jgi:pilus assembly protein CpaB
VKKYKPVILIVATVLVALATSLLVYVWLKDRSVAIASRRGELVSVTVAATDLGWGTQLKPDMVKVVPFLKGSVPSGYFSDAAAVAGRVVIAPIKAGEPVFESRLAPTNVTEGGVAAVIARNKRAMTVRVDKVKGVSGFIHPGNRVDVVATFRPNYAQMPMTLTVLEAIPVLAVGTDMELRSKQEKPVEVDVITLEVSPSQAEVLALASTEGKLQLSLRNFSDTDDSATEGVSVQSLIAVLSGKRTTPVKGRHKGSWGSYAQVQLIEGQKVNDVKFREGSK